MLSTGGGDDQDLSASLSLLLLDEEDGFIHIRDNIIYDMQVSLSEVYNIFKNDHGINIILRIYFPDPSYKFTQPEVDKFMKNIKLLVPRVETVKFLVQTNFKLHVNVQCRYTDSDLIFFKLSNRNKVRSELEIGLKPLLKFCLVDSKANSLLLNNRVQVEVNSTNYQDKSWEGEDEVVVVGDDKGQLTMAELMGFTNLFRTK